ncbi:hypothetical protein B0T19DRAFT_206256 [Cercophora scortea]|uniref:Uncharacterized protein n=1 Tax=Cercophora scortea TaxID=314031 RepID=A0AAE0IEE6_9PEZI|nr:hypothetical protein B0T19DRAFT_206256 [Cercophora scortea]
MMLEKKPSLPLPPPHLRSPFSAHRGCKMTKRTEWPVASSSSDSAHRHPFHVLHLCLAYKLDLSLFVTSTKICCLSVQTMLILSVLTSFSFPDQSASSTHTVSLCARKGLRESHCQCALDRPAYVRTCSDKKKQSWKAYFQAGLSSSFFLAWTFQISFPGFSPRFCKLIEPRVRLQR